MSSGPRLPRAQPPAFPILINLQVCWIATGPFGLLAEAFGSSVVGQQASQAAFAEYWRSQALRDRSKWLKVKEQQTVHFEITCDPRWQIVRIEVPADLLIHIGATHFFAAFSVEARIPYEVGFLQVYELETALAKDAIAYVEAEGEPSDSTPLPPPGGIRR